MEKNTNFIYKNLSPFKWFVLENFPFIEADFDALTEWQLFCKIGKEINKIINSQNIVGEQAETLTNAFNTLKNYVDNYFNNLDVQDEINNKLNDMVEQGTLQEIIADYLNSKAIFGYDNVNDMKQATNLIAGSYAKTLGYYSKNDGGMATYKIRTITNEDVVDEMFIISLNNNSLIAELIISKNIIMETLGLQENDEIDESNKLLVAFNKAKSINKSIVSSKNIIIKTPLNLDFNNSKINLDLNIKPILLGTALTFTNGIENKINIQVNNGNSENAIAITRMFHTDLNIKGYYHNGCLLRVYGNDKNDTHNLGMKISIRNFNCKQTLNHADTIPSSGFGEYNFVWEETWENLNAIGSIISNSYDVTINHWESHFVTNVENQINLTLQACKTCKINYLALGGKCSQLLKINTGSEIYADEIHLGSEDGTNVNGILLINSNLYVTDLKLVSVGTGVNLQDLTSLLKADNIVPTNVENLIIRNGYNFNYPNKKMSFTNIETYPLNRLEVKHISPTVNITNGSGTISVDITQYDWDILLGANVIPYGTSNGFTLGISSDNNGNYTLGIKCLNSTYNNDSLQLRIILFGYKQLN